jgi:hypothetical protein
MAFLPEAFDPSQETGSGSFEPLPPGIYMATIVEADVKQPKSGVGHMLALTWKIADGEHDGRQVWQSCVISHSSEAAQRIGRSQTKDICDALHLTAAVTDTDVFLHQTAMIKVAIEQDKNGVYEPRNKVTKVTPVDAAGQSNGTARQAPHVGPNVMQPAPKPAAGAVPPWAR